MINGLVSLILPIYNIKENYLRKCVVSLIEQTYEKLEIILVNDGSNNGIERTCIECVDMDKRVRYIEQNNSGVSVARNNGFKKSLGEYICFIDPDDWVEKTYVETLYNAINLSGADFVLTDCMVCYENHSVENRFLNQKESDLQGKEKNKLLYQLVGKKISDYYPPEIAAGVPWGKMFRRTFIEKNNLCFIPGMVRMQDNIYCLYAIENAKKIHYIPGLLYNYRKEIGSACYKYSPSIVDYFERYFDETRKFLDINRKEDIMNKALSMKELTSFNSYFVQYFFHEEYDKKYAVMKQEITDLLEKPRYRKDIEAIDYKLLNKQEKIFVFLLKYRMYFILKIIVKIRNKFRM